jgi:hypothetical protein
MQPIIIEEKKLPGSLKMSIAETIGRMPPKLQ